LETVNQDVNVSEYLTPRDVTTLPKRRGREASNLYPRIVEAFIASGEGASQVNVAKIGRKPATVRSALVKAVKAQGCQDKVRVSLIGDEVILVTR
jgi:hypothetical protein